MFVYSACGIVRSIDPQPPHPPVLPTTIIPPSSVVLPGSFRPNNTHIKNHTFPTEVLITHYSFHCFHLLRFISAADDATTPMQSPIKSRRWTWPASHPRLHSAPSGATWSTMAQLASKHRKFPKGSRMSSDGSNRCLLFLSRKLDCFLLIYFTCHPPPPLKCCQIPK